MMKVLSEWRVIEGERTVKVFAMESLGAESLAVSLAAGRVVTLPKMTSIAISLGVSRVLEKTLE